MFSKFVMQLFYFFIFCWKLLEFARDHLAALKCDACESKRVLCPNLQKIYGNFEKLEGPLNISFLDFTLISAIAKSQTPGGTE